MGRGRAKAKQTKVARELKYSTGSMDLDRLQRDLRSGEPVSAPLTPVEEDPYGSYLDEEAEEEEPAAG